MSTLKTLEKLELNWDGYMAEPPTKQAIETGKLMVKSWQALPDGGIQLEFIDKDHREVTVIVGPDGNILGVDFFLN